MKKVEFCVTCQKSDCKCYEREMTKMLKITIYFIIFFLSAIFLKSLIYTFS